MTLEDANEGGLLGEMVSLDLEFSGPTDAPTKLMAKFRPPDTSSQITTALFDLCENEYDFYRTIQPTMLETANTRIPKMVYGDFHRPSGTFIMLYEFVTATFTQIQNPTPKEKSALVFEKLAAIHSTFWGGEYLNGSVEFIDVVNSGAQNLLPKVTSDSLKKFYTGAAAGASNTASPELKVAINEMYSKGTLGSIQEHFASNKAWFTVCHGDPRIDNWFFDEKDGANNIGLLDWQLMVRGGCALDVSWYFNTTVDADDAQNDGLIDTYFAALSKERGESRRQTLPSIEEFKEEVALAHVYSFCKTIIGAGGLNKNDRNTCEVMSLLTTRGIKAMVKHDTIGTFRAFKAGGMLSQKRMAGSDSAVTPRADPA
jgi:thiamine kinase-like enzyme